MSFLEKYPMRGQFEYNGVLFFGDDPVGMMSAEGLAKIGEEFEVREDDVVIDSYPRTGTHWTAEIVSLILFDEKHHNKDHFDKIPYLEWWSNSKILQDEPRETPRFYMTHLRPSMLPEQLRTQGKVIYPIRNPKDTAVSMYHFYRIAVNLGSYEGPWSEFLEAFMNGQMMYGDYFDHLLSWWERREDDNVLIVRYEEMRKNPFKAVRDIANFMGKTLTEEEVEKIASKTSFEVMKKNPLTNLSLTLKNIFVEREPGEDFVRKGKVGNWKEYFTVAQSEAFDKLIEERLQGSGIDFEYQ